MPVCSGEISKRTVLFTRLTLNCGSCAYVRYDNWCWGDLDVQRVELGLPNRAETCKAGSDELTGGSALIFCPAG